MLAGGTITRVNVVGIALMDKIFAVLVSEMRSGNAYVNVYTEAHPLDPNVQTPQPGEIRSQIKLVD